MELVTSLIHPSVLECYFEWVECDKPLKYCVDMPRSYDGTHPGFILREYVKLPIVNDKVCDTYETFMGKLIFMVIENKGVMSEANCIRICVVFLALPSNPHNDFVEILGDDNMEMIYLLDDLYNGMRVGISDPTKDKGVLMATLDTVYGVLRYIDRHYLPTLLRCNVQYTVQSEKSTIAGIHLLHRVGVLGVKVRKTLRGRCGYPDLSTPTADAIEGVGIRECVGMCTPYNQKCRVPVEEYLYMIHFMHMDDDSRIPGHLKSTRMTRSRVLYKACVGHTYPRSDSIIVRHPFMELMVYLSGENWLDVYMYEMHWRRPSQDKILRMEIMRLVGWRPNMPHLLRFILGK